MGTLLVSNFSKSFVELFFMFLAKKFNFVLDFEDQKNQFEKTKFVPRFWFKS
jgi:hypothetical protein